MTQYGDTGRMPDHKHSVNMGICALVDARIDVKNRCTTGQPRTLRRVGEFQCIQARSRAVLRVVNVRLGSKTEKR